MLEAYVFRPTHIRRDGHEEVQAVTAVIMQSEPHDGLVGVLYKDRQGKAYVKLLPDFEASYKPLRDPIEEAAARIEQNR